MIVLLWRALFDARAATMLGALAAGHPELGEQLVGVCVREAPRCELVGVSPP